MSEVRPAAVAGQFYPGQAAQLQAEVDTLLDRASTDAATGAACPKAIVAPHAGYIYSGGVAAEAYARVKNGAGKISRVLLLGPSHRVGFNGIALSTADFYLTPLGQVPVDKAALDKIRQLPAVVELPQAHAQEHSLEVHLPFLQRCLDAFVLVPLVVGQTRPEDVARVLEALWGGPETLIVVSSDLSHYLPYAEAQAKDTATSSLIEAREPSLSGDQACGCNPLNGLLQVLQQRQLPIQALQVKNSGDTAGSKDRVVGYGAYVVEAGVVKTGLAETTVVEEQRDPDSQQLSLSQRQQLLYLARNAILGQLLKQADFNIQLNQYHASLHRQLASFVTLNHRGRLRGCIGSLAASRALVVDVASNAIAAAFKDPRFKPLRLEEFPELELHISVLSEPQAIAVNSRQELVERLRPGRDGLILQQGNHRATYLPSVWKQIPEPDRFLGELRAKAGLPREGWSDEMTVSLYTTEEFS